MIRAQLIGSPTCRRYQRMREILMAAAIRLDIPVDLNEINDTQRLMQFNPLSLPQFTIDGHLMAVGNPPAKTDVERRLREVSDQQ
jgi:hypothetical protein